MEMVRNIEFVICRENMYGYFVGNGFVRYMINMCRGQIFHTTQLYFIGDPHHVNTIMNF